MTGVPALRWAAIFASAPKPESGTNRVLVLGSVLVFPFLVDSNREIDHITVRGGFLFGVFAEVCLRDGRCFCSWT